MPNINCFLQLQYDILIERFENSSASKANAQPQKIRTGYSLWFENAQRTGESPDGETY